MFGRKFTVLSTENVHKFRRGNWLKNCQAVFLSRPASLVRLFQTVSVELVGCPAINQRSDFKVVFLQHHHVSVAFESPVFESNEVDGDAGLPEDVFFARPRRTAPD